MTTSTIVLIVVVAVVAILLIAAIAWVARKKRTQHRRVEAGDIRDKAAEQSHEVGQREALADETAAKARAAQAEADAKAAHATGLQHQARSASQRRGHRPRRGEPGVRARRHDRIRTRKPTATHRDKTPKPARHLEEPPPASKAHPRCPDPGDVANPRRPDLAGSSPTDPCRGNANYVWAGGPSCESADGCVSTSHATSRAAAPPRTIPPAG